MFKRIFITVLGFCLIACGITVIANAGSNAEGVAVDYGEVETAPETRASWLSGWAYGFSIAISNSGASDLTNYVLKLDINSTNNPSVSFGHFRADIGDLRFTASDHATFLSHWEPYYSIANEEITSWVKVPSILAGSSTTIWCHYGKATATGTANGSAVFSYFDTFTGSDYTYREALSDNIGGDKAIYSKSAAPILWPITTSYPEGNLSGVSVGYISSTDHLIWGSYDDTNAGVFGAASTTGLTFHDNRYTNNPIINYTANSDDPDELKATEPDWFTNITSDYKMEILNDSTYGITIYYSAFNTSAGFSICAANVSSGIDPDNTWNKEGVMLSADDVDWASQVRKPVVWCQNETGADYRMLFAGYAGGTWQIGYAFATTIMGPWTPYAFPVANSSAWGWASDSVIPCDIWHNGSSWSMSFGGATGEGDWRTGIMTCDDDDMVKWTKWAGVSPWGDLETDDWDNDNNQYSTFNIADRGDSTERGLLYQSGTNNSYVSMGYSTLYNSTWEHYGTAVSVFALRNGKLRVDSNETYLIKNLTGGEDADYDNYTASVDFWFRADTPAANNFSIVMRAGDALWASRSFVAATLSQNTPILYSERLLAATPTGLNATDALGTVGGENSQGNLRVYSSGLMSNAYIEDYAEDTIDYVDGVDNQHTSGFYGIVQTDIAESVDFDFFRVIAYGNATTTGTVYGSPTTDPNVEYSGGGGGGYIIIDDTDTTTNTTEDDDGSLCCGSTGMLMILPGVAMVMTANNPKRNKKL